MVDRDQGRPGGILPPSWVQSSRFVPSTFVRPVLSFMRLEAAGGIAMLVAAIVAVAWANSPVGETYFELFEARVAITVGGFELRHLANLTVREWINDAAMVVFFFVVGLEIKRELVVGELRDPRAAALPAVAALGGMVVPAAIYLAINAGGDYSQGWGIPMATDIAFAVGVVSLAGERVPIGAKLFLLALAIVDDLGAIVVIALVYTSDISLGWLVAAVVGLLVVIAMNRAGIRPRLAYLAVGVLVWLAMLESGIHATLTGVVLAFITPVRPLYSPRRFAARARRLVDRAEAHMPDNELALAADHRATERVVPILNDLRRLATETVSPLDRLELTLAPWTSYVVVPLFALANAGVVISGDALSGLTSDPVTVGVALGLLVGKVVGVTGFAWAAVRLGLGRLPRFTTWTHMLGLGLLAGIGFTVAIFVATLAFTDPAAADAAKIGIFGGSLVAGLLGFIVLRFVAPGRDVLDADHDYVPDDRQAVARG